MKELLLFYKKPSTFMNRLDTWQEETLALGNGIIGATVWGEMQSERITLNEETLWSGGKNHENKNDAYNGGNPKKDVRSAYEEIAHKVRSGEGFDKEELRGLYDGYAHGYQCAGDLFIDFADLPKRPPKDYIRSLSLSKAQANVSFSCGDKRYKRTYFVSNPDNVLACLFECEGADLDFSLRFSSPHKCEKKSFTENGTAYAVYEGLIDDNKLKFSTVLSVCAYGGSVRESGGVISVKNTGKAAVYLSVGTDYANEFYNSDKSIEYYYRSGETGEELTQKILSRVKSAVLSGFDTVYDRHEKDYCALYERTKLELCQNSDKPTDKLLKLYKKGLLKKEEKRFLEVLLFQYGRYLLISSSRENSVLPSNLQGIWNAFAKPAWGSDIHININEQMNYWLSSGANLNECALPLIRYVSSLKEPGKRTASLIFGTENGFMAHTQNTPFGFTAAGWEIGLWGWCPAAVAWLMQNCYDYYEYSLDRDTLEKTIYPMMKDQVRLYEEILVEYGEKKLMPIAQSPEIGTLTFSNTYEQSLIWQLYADTIEASEILGADENERRLWRDTLERLSPIEIGQSGQVKEWYEETTLNSVCDTRKHRHLSNLLGLFPGNLFDTQEKKNAAYVSLMNKRFGHIGARLSPEGGWTYAQLMCTWARLANGENAYFCLNSLIKERLYQNLFDYHKYGKYGAFQIDANLGYTAGVCEMLLQSNLGYLDILPALPPEWENGSFEGLKAEGAFVVGAKWKNGKLESAEILSLKGMPCSIKAHASLCVYDENSNKIETEKNGDIISFPTVCGMRCTLSYIEK